MATVEGYSKPMSVQPQETITFHISASVDYNVTYLRLTDFVEGGASIPGERIPLLHAAHYPAHPNQLPVHAWRDGCGWPESFSLEVPPQWSSGIYAAECTGSDQSVSYIIFIVKRNPNQKAYFAALANTNTWNAYNGWGGRSRYTPPYAENTRISFERPNPLTAPNANVEHLTRPELWVLKWLKLSGYNVDVYSDHDFHQGIPDFSTYRALIVSTHPEYWTIEMVNNLESYLHSGGNLLYLGGNGLFECVKFNHDGSSLIFLGGTRGKIRDEFYFRNLKPLRPERALLGVGYLYDNYYSPAAPYEVMMAEHRFFAGTGLVNGGSIGSGNLLSSTFGNASFPPLGAASGLEMDTSEPGFSTVETVNAWESNSGTDRGSPPPNLQLLAKGKNQRVQGKNPDGSWDGKLQGPHSAHLTYYDTTYGGFVLSAGSMIFGGSLVQDVKLQRLIKNALNECLPINLAHLQPLLL
jgi:hypothetical protein